ncbi:membrane protease subunit HflC [Andreprevotia lacus DSM 23236]|jgi:membrane protease subunit HflC|uniref:Protein HflC n=1 Tax=Andreprevotia lacus DSM 23236 TaxID=1121001 RepID=A0A1W1XLQ4_9NEIS|nr:protease modulator HflC [Andreprevotia lacus]SMC24909.1 membrane protease subunit HflC [Andreprevotia lacus DSM 23236]
MSRILPALAVVLVALFVLSLSFFTVDQRQSAVVFQFSEFKRVIKQPGFNFKVPLLQEVRYFDNRIQTIDAQAPARIQTIEKMNVKADSFIKWQIVDVERYYRAVGLDRDKAVDRLRNTVNNMLRDEFGKLTVQDVISGKRDEVMAKVRGLADADAARIGVRVIDVRIKRVELEDSTLTSVYERMQSERKAVANQLRAEGSAEAEKIKAEAEKQREVILADAYNQAQQLKGEGDAKAAAIYAEAYGRNPEFYAFYKSLDAYKKSFAKKSDVLVVDPSADFFKYMKNPKAGNGK